MEALKSEAFEEKKAIEFSSIMAKNKKAKFSKDIEERV